MHACPPATSYLSCAPDTDHAPDTAHLLHTPGRKANPGQWHVKRHQLGMTLAVLATRNSPPMAARPRGGTVRLRGMVGNRMCFARGEDHAAGWFIRPDGQNATWLRDGKMGGSQAILRGNPNRQGN